MTMDPVEPHPFMLLGITVDDITLLDRLNEGPSSDGVGLESGELTEPETKRANGLVRRGFLTLSGGWRSSTLYRLSKNGRMLLDLRDDLPAK